MLLEFTLVWSRDWQTRTLWKDSLDQNFRERNSAPELLTPVCVNNDVTPEHRSFRNRMVPYAIPGAAHQYGSSRTSQEQA